MTLNALSHQPTLAHQSAVGAGLNANPGGNEYYQPVDIHRALDEVRQMPEFAPTKPNWLEELWKQPWVKKLSHQVGDAIHQVLKAIGQVFSHVKPPGLSHLPDNIRDIFSGFVGFILVLVGLFALYLFLGWLLRLKDKNGPLPPAEARMLEQTVLISSEHHYGQARQSAERGDYADALKHLYMATLCLLDERKIAPYEATRTNLEYAALLEQAKMAHAMQTQADEGKPSLKACFERLARQFEAVRYGLLPIDQGQFEHSRSVYEDMQRLVAGQIHE